MEKVRDLALHLISLDREKKLFNKELVSLNGRKCYEGNVRLNKYLHICQMVYMAMHEEKLFEENMYAFVNGIVVEEVMNDYNYLVSQREATVNLSNETKTFMTRMFEILYDAPLNDLIEISHQDKEWQDKSKFSTKEEQKINPDSQLENYKKMCKNFIYLMEQCEC